MTAKTTRSRVAPERHARVTGLRGPHDSAANATVGERLLICRNATGLSKAEVARKLGIAQSSVGELETGRSKKPAADTLLDMRDRLGYNPDYVIRGKGMPLLPNFEELAKEQALILIFRELRPELRDEAVRAVQGLRRAQGGASSNDPFPRDPPRGDGTQ
jgi:transcriptional regulator with XRE-family HTH domain